VKIRVEVFWVVTPSPSRWKQQGPPKCSLKVEVKSSQCFLSYFSMTPWRRTGGVEVHLHAFLTLALDGDQLLASRFGRFTPKERAPGTHWIGGWVGPWAVLDAVVKRQIPSPRRESNPKTPIVQSIDRLQVKLQTKDKRQTDSGSYCSPDTCFSLIPSSLDDIKWWSLNAGLQAPPDLRESLPGSNALWR
jgi:hypothetical protein